MGKFLELQGAFAAKTVEVGGIATRYLEAGQGPPVVLIHGGGAGADCYGNWYDCIPRLAESFRVYSIDMLGFGRNDHPDPAHFAYTQDARVEHLAGFVEALGLSRVSLVGNSMGGMTSIGVTVSRPGLVDKLVLMGSAGLNRGVREEMRPLQSYDYSREGMVKIIDVLTHESFVAEDGMIDYRYELATEPATRKAYSATMAWVKEQRGLFYEEDFIRQVAVPTLVTGGKNDIVVPLEIAMRFLELIDNSWGYFIPHCGHWAMLEHPEDFAAATTKFLLTS